MGADARVTAGALCVSLAALDDMLAGLAMVGGSARAQLDLGIAAKGVLRIAKMQTA